MKCGCPHLQEGLYPIYYTIIRTFQAVLKQEHHNEEYRLTPVRIDDSEECIASIIRVTTIGEIGTALAVTIN
jgi:hypothetical protein